VSEQLVLVTDADGAEFSVPASELERDPSLTPVEGQELRVAPAGGEGEVLAQEVTGRTLADPGKLAEPAAAVLQLQEETREELYSGAGEAITQGLKAAASAATFGAADILLESGKSGLEREAERARQAQQSTARLVGGLAGAVVPGLLSGGTGAIGTLARLTPAGRLSAATGRLASRGGLAHITGAGALEGMAGAAGDYVARVTLDEHATFSGEVLAGDVLKGALFGGLAGGAVDVLARGAGRLGRVADDAPIGRLADDVAPPAPALLSEPTTNFKSIVRKRLRDDDAAALRSLGDEIDSAVARGARTELDDLVTSTRFVEVADDGARALATQAQETADALAKASTETQRAFQALADDVGLAQAKRKITKTASEPVEDAFVASVAEADQLALKYQRELDELRARVGIEVPPPVTPDPLGKLDNALGDSEPGRLARLGAMAGKALGVAELARTAGLDVPIPSVRDIPLVGPLMGLYFQAQGVRAAAKGIGVLPSTVATRAAGKVVSTEARVVDRVRAFASGVARKAAASMPTKQAIAGIGSQMAQVAGADSAQTAANAGTATGETTTGVQRAAMDAAARAVDYLQAHTPTDPLGYRAPGMTPWAPTTQQALDWTRRRDTVLDPASGVDMLLNSATSSLELEALEAVYPALLEQVRAELMDTLDELHANRSPAEIRSLALNLDLPIIPETTIPGYGISQAWAPAQQLKPQPQFARPSTPGASPSVRLEDPIARQGR
jgi:hypothetical protein